MTLRWRERDSNRQSRRERDDTGERSDGAQPIHHHVDFVGIPQLRSRGGTGSSNPPPSSGESANQITPEDLTNLWGSGQNSHETVSQYELLNRNCGSCLAGFRRLGREQEHQKPGPHRQCMHVCRAADSATPALEMPESYLLAARRRNVRFISVDLGQICCEKFYSTRVTNEVAHGRRENRRETERALRDHRLHRITRHERECLANSGKDRALSLRCIYEQAVL